MIHPRTALRTVSELIGNGVVATELIPQGTIMVVRDRYDLSLTGEEFRLLPEEMQRQMETHMYRDKVGNLILGWDHARYMNHNCHSNTLMTDYNLEIVIRDIEKGEEVTTDYGLLNVIEPYPIFCGCTGCRGHLQLDDIDRFADRWDAMVRESLMLIGSVPQPLLQMMQPSDRERLEKVLRGEAPYSSVQHLKWRP